ncbi:MAG: YdcF family protein [Candidatus Sulfotelmatobacter sp.]
MNNGRINHGIANGHVPRRWWISLLALFVTVLALCLSITAVQVVHTASLEEIHPADAIVVFGAAEYSGHPSPVLRARLDHAFDLFQDHVAPVVITTGGAAADPKFSEGGVGKEYLRRRGIPENALIAETQSSDTAESAERVAVIMRTNGLHSCVAVSDAYHVFRIRKLLEHQGVGPVYVAPRADSRPHGPMQRAVAVLREATSYLLWRVGI